MKKNEKPDCSYLERRDEDQPLLNDLFKLNSEINKRGGFLEGKT